MVFGVYKCHGVSLYIRIIIFIVVFVIDNLMNEYQPKLDSTQVTTAVDTTCGLGAWVVAAACLFGGCP